MYGLTVRWSLAQAPDGAEDALREYVTGTSLARFSAMDGLCFKTWRMRAGEWFEGIYVWQDAAGRDAFAEQFSATGSDNPGSQLIGSGPALIETFEVVAVAEGLAGFSKGPGPGSL
ncbi:hypothetical protein ACPPVT_05515 [Angustibacter sp. McL0619]|uniref:hypothetical protein n=1 Tax=Angustibacter sp. McL0619 TaxID=3415676 RepID=UPI003CF19128